MNQRIKELAIQAGLKWKGQPPHFSNTSNPTDFPQSANADLEKFAELIIQECAEVAGCNGHVSGFTLGDLIKEHFSQPNSLVDCLKNQSQGV